MSAELLRGAAEILRMRAGRATDGPWRSEGQMGMTRQIYAEPGILRGQGRDLAVAEGMFGRDAAYVITMHPGVGLALADWLEDEVHRAKYREDQQADMNLSRVRSEPFPAYYDRSTRYALDVARLIVGEQS